MDNAATSSGTGSHVKSFLIEMGFCSTLVHKAIDENGEDNLELLLEILTKTNEPVVEHEAPGTRMALLTMKFPEKLVDFARDRLGKDTPIDELVDFIAAAQLAEKYNAQSQDSLHCIESNASEDVVPVAARGHEGKTLHLLEMGFSHHEISMAIEKIGTQAQVSDLAELIVTGEVPAEFTLKGKGKDGDAGGASGSKRPKDEDEDAYPDFYANFDGGAKRVRMEYMGGTVTCMETSRMEHESRQMPRSIFPPDIPKRPYFFYGSFGEVSPQWWSKISRCFYDIQPEHVDTRLRSALHRKEGYLHNLPTANRFSILPKPTLSIQESTPQMKSCWPQWDVRKHLNGSACSRTKEVTYLCGRIGRRLAECRGKPSQQEQALILADCRTSNLIWTAPNTLSPVEPEHLECIMGYPRNHTNLGGRLATERLKLLDYCFQTDTLGYHLSVLKSMFPQGLAVLSIFSGIGGAEIALSRLGIHLKRVVSIETCEMSRKILKRWWEISGQTGSLEQIESITSFRSKKIEDLVKRFGGFDLVICQNPTTPTNLCKESSRSEASDFSYTLFNEFVRIAKCVKCVQEDSNE